MSIELYRFLHQQGYGGRKACKELIKAGAIELNGIEQQDYRTIINPEEIKNITINGNLFPVWQLPLYAMLNKPSGYETSHKASYHPSVFQLLPTQFSELGIQAIGRLDADTSGLILFTTDGQFAHQVSSPKKQVDKCYRITLKHPVNSALIEQLLNGVLLKDEEQIIIAKKVVQLDEYTIDMSITQGKYHQVKRMIAAVNNRVEALHRLSIGELNLGSLATGEWRFLLKKEVDYLYGKR